MAGPMRVALQGDPIRMFAAQQMNAPPEPTCPICANARGNKRHAAREMMFALHDPFTYGECAGCGCLWLMDPPADMARYYAKDYYSFDAADEQLIGRNKRKNRAMRALLAYRMHGAHPLGWAISKRFDHFRWVRRGTLSFDARVLDVGCGSGHLLLTLAHCGFTDLVGADPFVANDITYRCGVRILKRDVFGMEGPFDFIMLNHAFEHMADPLPVLQRLHQLLAPGGVVMIRIPVAASYAWEHYGTNWVQLDAPRHFFLHTTRSMEMLSQQASFTLEHVENDSSAFQFTGSEKYLRGLPLNTLEEPFTPAQLKSFIAKAEHLNKEGRGDTSSFYLRKAG